MAKKTPRQDSLKKIVADIDAALAELEKSSPTGASLPSTHKITRAKLSLKAARDAVQRACVPNFDFPEAE